MRLKNTTNTQTSERTKNNTTHRRLFARNVTVSVPFLAFLALCSCLTKLSRMKKKAPLCVLLWSTPPHKKKKHTNTNVCHAPTTSLFLPGFHVGDDHHPQAEEITSDEDDLERRGRPRRRHGYVLFSSIPFFFYRDVVIHLSG